MDIALGSHMLFTFQDFLVANFLVAHDGLGDRLASISALYHAVFNAC